MERGAGLGPDPSSEPVPPADGVPGAASPPSGPFTRLAWILASPVRLFRELREEPRALGALVLGIVITALASAAIPVDLWEEGIRAGLAAGGEDLPADPALLARVAWVSAVFVGVIAWPLLALATTAVYAVVFLFGLGYQGSFRGLLSVVAHALLVVALGSLVLVPLRILAEDPQLTLSVGTLLPFLGEGFLGRLFGLLDLFNLWAYLLIGIGAATLDGSRPTGQGAAISLGVALLLSAALAGIMGLATGGAPG